MRAYLVLLTTVICAAIGVFCHPARPPVLDPTRARELFVLAEKNRTADGFLTPLEVDEIFADFDLDGDNQVTGQEMQTVWVSQGLGDAASASLLFNRADTDKNGVITDIPDLQRVFTYFDLNGDGVVSEPEFVVVWASLTS